MKFGLTLLLLLVHRRQVAALKFGLQKENLVGFESEIDTKSAETAFGWI